jgi:hypothetical protein
MFLCAHQSEWTRDENIRIERQTASIVDSQRKNGRLGLEMRFLWLPIKIVTCLKGASVKFKHQYALLVILTPLFCHAESAGNIVTECVGNLNIDFPGEVEVAANSVNMLIKEHDVAAIQPSFEFPDGEKSGWASMHYNGKLFTSHLLSDKQSTQMFHLQEKMKATAKQFSSKQQKKDIRPSVKDVNIGFASGVAFHVGGSFSTSVFTHGHMLWFQSSVADTGIAKYKKDLADFVKNLSYRPIGLVPESQGLCFPYFFVTVEPNGNADRRKISAMYRLKQHPDIAIWIEDSDTTVSPSDTLVKTDSPRDRINEFWTQYGSNPGIEKIESEWSLPSGRKVTIGKNSGLASFMRIHRKGGLVDYGYMATAHGDAGQKTEASNVNFFVIRRSENSKAKGITPVTSDEFIKLSQDIVSTIKIRAALDYCLLHLFFNAEKSLALRSY